MLQMGLALAAAFGALGVLGLIVGLGLIWASRASGFDRIEAADTAEGIVLPAEERERLGVSG